MTELVLLPGTLCDDRLWSAQEPAWAALPSVERVRHVPLDAPSIDAMVDAVLSAGPDELEESLLLVGCSLGGIVAQATQRLAPERVAAMVLISTTARPPRPEQPGQWRELAERTLADGVESVARRLLPSLVHDAGAPAVVDTVVDMARATGAATYLHQLAAQSTRIDERPALATCAVPVLAVSAEHDPLCPAALGQELAELAPLGRFELVAGVGHLTPLEAPQVLCDVVGGWLRQLSPNVATAP